MTIQEIMKNFKRVAVYGMSANPSKPAFYVPELLSKNGYDIYPINPSAEEILGIKVFPKLIDVDGEIDILNVFRPSEQTVQVVQEAIERKKIRGDIKVIWLQEGIINEEAKKLALENGFIFIQDKCMKVEFFKL